MSADFVVPEMDNTTRRRILSLFPRGANDFRSQTCQYINQYSYIICGAPCEDGSDACACVYHRRDFQLWTSVLAQQSTEPAVVPNVVPDSPIHFVETLPVVAGVTTIDVFPLLIEAPNTCPVCEEGVDLLSLPCRHVTCLACYNQLTSKKCPVCRCEINPNFVRRME